MYSQNVPNHYNKILSKTCKMNRTYDTRNTTDKQWEKFRQEITNQITKQNKLNNIQRWNPNTTWNNTWDIISKAAYSHISKIKKPRKKHNNTFQSHMIEQILN